MDIADALRTTGAVREFTDQSIDDETLATVLKLARFAPSGGNRQAWRVIIVRDPVQRRRVRDHYLEGWHEYVSHVLAGVVPFSPLATPAQRAAAGAQLDAARALARPDGFAETLDQVPVLLVIAADLGALAATDRDLARYQMVGGASIYPFVWSILLAARDLDLGGVMTTVATRDEVALRTTLHLPATFAVAAVVALGHPRRRPTRLTRHPVETFTTFDTFDGPSFVPPR
ncbi:MAG: nitroreductase family protein [Acidimicrobiales bacterium]